MPRLQADRTKYRWARISTALQANAAPSDGITPPDFTMSPLAPSKMPTTGLALMIKRPLTALAAVPVALGFTIVMWVRDPATLAYSAFAAVSVPYDSLFVTFDIDASDIYFQIGGVSVDGFVDIGIAEQ